MTAEPRIFGNSEIIALNDETVGLVAPVPLVRHSEQKLACRVVAAVNSLGDIADDEPLLP